MKRKTTLPSSQTLAEAIQSERDLVATIQQDSKRLTRPFTIALAKTFILPYLIFMAAWLLGSRLREYIDVTFQDGSLSSLTVFSTTLGMLALTWYAWRWSERRFGGLAMMRRMAQVSKAVLDAEQAIDAVRSKPTISPADVQQIEALTRRAWDIYVNSMRAAGLDVPPSGEP